MVEAIEDALDAPLEVLLAEEEEVPASPEAASAPSLELLLERLPTTPPTTAATMTTTATGIPIFTHLLSTTIAGGERERCCREKSGMCVGREFL